MYSFIASICATLTSAGAAVHYDKPEPTPLRADKVVHVGRYVGARNTTALDRAQTSIFFKQDKADNSPYNPFIVHVAESVMVVRQRMAAARTAYAADSMQPILATPSNAPVAEVPQPAPAPAPAANSRPVAPSGFSGGFKGGF